MNTDLNISILPGSGEPIVEQLHQQFTWFIASGRLKPGDNLPAVRQLARQLSINLHTVRSAYQRLEKDGLVRIHQGSRTQVLILDSSRVMQLAGRNRTYTIGVIVPSLSNPFYHAFLQGVEEVVDQENLMLFVCDVHEDSDRYLRYFAQLSARNVDGIIVASFNLRPGMQQPVSSIPVVNADWPGCLGPVVNFDLENAAYQAVRHLLEHGHHRIAEITYSGSTANVIAMDAGYARALQEGGLALDESLIVRVPGFDIPSGQSAAHMLLGRGVSPTAVFTIADMLALGVMKTLRKAGFRIPDQVALASLDDIPLADLVAPGLTTVSLPVRKLGVESMQMLRILIEGKQPSPKQVTLSARLVIRQSCGCLPFQ
jgi:DNA-binding LacI/PurR family transcriptional regulator